MDIQQPKRILVTIPGISLFQRQILEGILEYRSDEQPCQYIVDVGDLLQQRLRNFNHWKIDGMIALVLDDDHRKRIIATGLPCVLLEPCLKRRPSWLPRNAVSFINDFRREGELVAEYFLKRGYQSIAYVDDSVPTFWGTERGHAIKAALKKAGIEPLFYPGCPQSERGDFPREAGRLAAWLGTLPKPTAVYCVHDHRAQQVVCAAGDAGLRIPQDLAVLGIDNDELICNMTVPKLSSIDTGIRKCGTRAAQAITKLLAHRPVKREQISSMATIVTRASTDSDSYDDPLVTRTMGFARAHNGLISVPELATLAGCSKSELNKRFRRVLGMSVGDKLRRDRLDQAISLLKTTDRTVEEIAILCGFRGASHLGLRLRTTFNHTPSYYRN